MFLFNLPCYTFTASAKEVVFPLFVCRMEDAKAAIWIFMKLARMGDKDKGMMEELYIHPCESVCFFWGIIILF